MKNIIRRQTEECSDYDMDRLCSIDTEVMDGKTKPLIHQAARFLIIQKGKCVLRIQGSDYKIEKQSVVALFPYEITEVVSVEESIQMYIVKYKYDILNMLINTLNVFREEGGSIFSDLEEKHVMHFDSQNWQRIILFARELEEELGLESVDAVEVRGEYSNVMCVSLLISLVVQLNRAAKESRHPDRAGEFDKSEILRYIYLHLNSKLSVQMLAEKFFISQSSVRRYILDMTGLTFTDLVNEMKIARTANYLLYTDMTLDELADVLGYVDASHISKLFRARIGMRISDYRECYQKVQKICGIEETRTNYAIVEYIAQNYTQHLTLKNVSERFGIGMRKMNEMLVYQLGQNFTEYLDSVRINNACRMLLETKKSVTDIAYAVGYNTIKTFNRKFINMKLMTPSEFRRKIGLQDYDV